MMTTADLLRVIRFATAAHGDQKRKYTGEPYIVHPLDVAERVARVGGSDEMIAAAVLHDVVEDTPRTIDEIEVAFGNEIADLVWWLTDVSTPADGNRAMRKERDRLHISIAPYAAKTIKLADLISNTLSITKHDKNFAVVYMKEKELLLQVLAAGNGELYREAKALLEEWKSSKL